MERNEQARGNRNSPRAVFIRGLVIVVVLVALVMGDRASAEETSLAGQWRFEIDSGDRGIGERWFDRELTNAIQLPGVLQAQSFGDEIGLQTPWVLSLYDRLWFLRADYWAYTNAGNVKVPFLCQPPRHYLGAAWYQRDIDVPNDWEGKRVMLFLERPRWESRAWLNDRLIGTNNSLCAPHEFDLGVLSPGTHRLTVRVDNRMLLPYRPDAHAVSDSLASTWNGVVGKIALQARDSVFIERVQIVPDLKRKGIDVTLFTRNETAEAVPARLVMLQVVPRNFGGNALKPVQQTAVIEPGASHLQLFFPMGDSFEEWSEFNPKIYRLRATIAGPGFRSDATETFGMREFRAEGREFVINGRKTNLRGTHHGGDFPLTGYPPTDVAYWRELWRTCTNWGINHVRFHSFCPPKAAFEAADEIGIYLQPEPGMWNTFDPGSAMEQMLYLETERILKAYGNHPSFVMFAASNEPKGRWKQVLPKWAEHFRKADAQRLYTTATGFTDADAPGPLESVDFTTTQRFGQKRLRGEPGWFGRDYSASVEGVTVPVLAHENGQWCAYPEFSVIEKFTGYMRPGNYEIFRDSAEANGLLAHNKELAWASGRFQLACYKEEIEANLRTMGMAGFQLLDLHDYVGQGTALVGLLDPFWEEKGYVTAEEWRRFCDVTVPLARLSKRVFTTDDRIESPVEVSHYGPGPLTNVTAEWKIVDRRNKVVAAGTFPARQIPVGKGFKLGTVSVDLRTLAAPGQYQLAASVRDLSRGTLFENDWNFWLYPASGADLPPDNVLVTRSWPQAKTRLAEGGRVLFVPRNTDLDWSSPPLDQVPIFWNRLMNPAWGRMLGLWCDTNHPALAGFPTEPNCDWQWIEITRGVRPVNLAGFPPALRPVVQAIDDWNRNWKLGAIFECRVGNGRLLVCAFDVVNSLANRPVARQLRHSLLSYMSGQSFEPGVEVSAGVLEAVLFDTRIMARLGATVSGEGPNAGAAMDGDPNTYWIAGGSGRGMTGTKHPHALTITFPSAVAMDGVVLMPRQNDRDHVGDIRQFKLEASDDGERWRELASGELVSTWSPQRVMLPSRTEAKHLRFTALSGFGNDTSAALAELAVLHFESKPEGQDAENFEYRRSRSTSTDVDEGGEAPSSGTNAVPRNP